MLHIGRNILSMVVSRILAGVVLFLIYTRLAQYLGPEAAGQYGLLASFLTVFSLFVDLGMTQLVIKNVSENKQETQKYLNNFFSTQLIIAICFALIMAAFVYFADYPQIVKNALYVTSVSLLLSSLSLPFRCIINAYQRMTIIAKVNFFNSVINGGFMVLAIILQKNIFFLSFISVSVATFDFLVYWYITHKNFAKFKLEFDKQFVKRLLVATAPFTMLTFFSIYNRIDTLLLPHFRNFEETGYYAAAYKFWDVLAFFPAVIGLSLYPFFAERLSKNLQDEARLGLETYTRYMIAIALPLAVGAFALAKPMTLAFYGEDFAPAAPALWLLVTAVAILFIYSPINSLMISQQTKAATKITGFTLLFNVTANIILLPQYGFVAAAVVTVLSELIQLVFYTIVIKRKVLSFHFGRNMIKPSVAVVCMYMVLLLLNGHFNVWVTVAIGAMAYGTILLLLKFFRRHDFELFKAAIDIRKDVRMKEDIA